MRFGVTALLALVWMLYGSALPAVALAEPYEMLFNLKDERITESSGLAMSPTHKGIVYTHNDSDDGPRFFAIDREGRTKATFTLAGAVARDWEAMAASRDASGKAWLWFGDIGDNDQGWSDISVYRVAEPVSLRGGTIKATRYRFTYEDGHRNAEGLMVHPTTGRLYVVSKELGGSVYEAPSTLRTGRENVLRRIAGAPSLATDASYAPDGRSFVIRTYFSARVYSAPGEEIAQVDLPSQDQGESVAHTSDGRALLVGSEGAESPIWEVPLSGSASPSPSVSPTPSGTAAASSSESGEGLLSTRGLVVFLAVALGAVGGISWLAYRASN